MSWTIEKIKNGFEEFKKIHGRYPASYEIDKFPGLPSSRQIQRAFGGLINLRKIIGLEITHLGIGANRSAIAKTVNERGYIEERNLEKILIDKFGEYFVHIEKPLFKYYLPFSKNQLRLKARADFFIYAGENYKFCIDVFFASNYRNLVNIINIKQKKYTDLTVDVYLVNANENIEEKLNDHNLIELQINKSNKLQKNIYLYNMTDFKTKLNNIKRIQIPIMSHKIHYAT